MRGWMFKMGRAAQARYTGQRDAAWPNTAQTIQASAVLGQGGHDTIPTLGVARPNTFGPGPVAKSGPARPRSDMGEVWVDLQTTDTARFTPLFPS